MAGVAERVGRFVENCLIAVLLLGMIGLGSAQIILRNFDLGTLVWADELVNHMVLWIAMVAGITAAREDRHISIDVLSRFLGPRARTVAAAVVDLFAAGVCAALAWYGWQMTEFALEDGETLLVGLPLWFAQGVIPVAFALMTWRYLVWFVRRSLRLAGRSGDPA